MGRIRINPSIRTPPDHTLRQVLSTGLLVQYNPDFRLLYLGYAGNFTTNLYAIDFGELPSFVPKMKNSFWLGSCGHVRITETDVQCCLDCTGYYETNGHFVVGIDESHESYTPSSSVMCRIIWFGLLPPENY